MADAQTIPTPILEQDYLAGEKLSSERHEYVDGQVYLQVFGCPVLLSA